MKKLFLFALAITLGMSMSAKVYYLLPGTEENGNQHKSALVNRGDVTNVYDLLPWEGDGTTDNNEVSPERKAYEYFESLYGTNYVTIKDLVEDDLPTDMTTLWVNVDRANLPLGGEGDYTFDKVFTAPLKDKLANFVKAGGNLYLSKQATRLVKEMGRAEWWPQHYTSNSYDNASDTWTMSVTFSTGGNPDPVHASLKYMVNGETLDGIANAQYPLVSGNGTYRRSNSNNGWGDWHIYAPNGEDTWACDKIERRNAFEGKNTCKILGSWGGSRCLDYAAMIDFLPTDTYKGRVMVVGIGAYQWGEQNASEYNVKNLTKGILEYLDAKEVYTRDVTVGNYGTLCLPYEATVENAVLFRIIDKEGTDNALTSITIEELESNVVKAGYSYIFRSTATPVVATMKSAYKVAEPINVVGSKNVNNGLFGNFEQTTVNINAGACYLIKDNQLRHIAADGVAKLAEYRAHIGADWIVSETAAPGRPVVVIPCLPTTPNATGVEEATAANATKALVNGKLVIVRGAHTFNANGSLLK